MNIATVSVGDREAPLFAPDTDWDAAQATLLEAELSDGLPAAIPTPARLTAMLAGCDPLLSFGAMPPLLGEITAQAVAWCCVIAGCRPAEFPVVLEAAIATLEPEFNLLGIQTTTGTPTVAAVVHGPAGPHECGDQLPWSRKSRECLYRPSAATGADQRWRRSAAGGRHGHDGPASQVWHGLR
jgi:hypothetical protein